MTQTPFRSPSSRHSRQGFKPLANEQLQMNSHDIPLQHVVSHTPSHQTHREVDDDNEKGMFTRGRRRLQKVDSKGTAMPSLNDGEEKTALNRMGKIYTKILNFSIITRYIIYVAPLALILAIPIILAVFNPDHKIGGADGRRFWIWIEIVWLSFWVCKIVAHFLPSVFQFLIGVVSPGVRKYALLLHALEKPLSIVFWMIVNQVTFPVLVKGTGGRAWFPKMQSVLLALLVISCVALAERILIQLISISYHRKQFDDKIKNSKRNIFLLGLLYDASRSLFPSYCQEFAEEDYIIHDSLNINLPLGKKKKKNSNKASGAATPMRLLHDLGRAGDKVTSVFGTVAQEITGKKVFDPNSAHSIVLEALERNRSAEALARRLWMSFVVEGKDSLYQDDLAEVMGAQRAEEAEECFSCLDRDGNGDVSLEEMILTVTEFGRERKSIATSMHDVDQAISALDALLGTIVFIVCIFIFVAFMSPSFTATLATSATAILSLSFVFATTCQEILGSCVFLFVKHPYDIGDRVDIGQDQLTVEHISLLYTVFKRVLNGKTVQIPNIVLNSLWVENITRSKAMREQVPIFVDFGTTFEDINLLKTEMQNFLRDPQNSRDFFPDIEIEVVSLAEMNKLELRCEIRHKSNWSNEALRASRRSKFMCALVVALRKIPIYGPGGGDAGLGSAGQPSWSVSISPEAAQAARDEYLAGMDAKRMIPTNKIDEPAGADDTAKTSGTDYLSPEASAINSLNNRRPGADPVRDDTWISRDDVSTLGRPSMDGQRPSIDEVRGLLHKMSSSGKRKASQTPNPISPSDRTLMPAFSVNPPSSSGSPYAPPQGPLPGPPGPSAMMPPSPYTPSLRAPGSPSSISTGRIEEFQYQNISGPIMAGQPQSSRQAGAQTQTFQEVEYPVSPPRPAVAAQPPRTAQSPTSPGSKNPYRAASP